MNKMTLTLIPYIVIAFLSALFGVVLIQLLFLSSLIISRVLINDLFISQGVVSNTTSEFSKNVIGAIGLVTGGLAGALVTWGVTQKRQKSDLSLKLVDYYLSMFSDYANAIHFLLPETSWTTISSEQENSVRKIMMWFDNIVVLWRNKFVDRRILRALEFDKIIKSFSERVQAKADNVQRVNNILLECQHLKDFSRYIGG